MEGDTSLFVMDSNSLWENNYVVCGGVVGELCLYLMTIRTTLEGDELSFVR